MNSGVISEWLWSWVLQIFDPRWLNNPVRLNAKVNSTPKKISVQSLCKSRQSLTTVCLEVTATNLYAPISYFSGLLSGSNRLGVITLPLMSEVSQYFCLATDNRHPTPWHHIHYVTMKAWMRVQSVRCTQGRRITRVRQSFIFIIKKGRQCKTEREWCTPHQSKDPSPTIPNYRQKEEKGKKSKRL